SFEVAELAAGPLGDLARAARLYEELRKKEPADRQAWEPLADAYRRLGERGKLVELIEETVPLVDELTERAGMRLEVASIVLEDDPERGAALLRDVLDEDPSQATAALLLSEILEKAGRSDELATLLASQLDSAKDRADTPTIVSLSIRLAALLEQRADDP